jgi:hypothetical protein
MTTNYNPYYGSYEDYQNTQIENGNVALETAALFREAQPYIIHENIFGEITYEWSEDFMQAMSDTLASGEYSLKFNKSEKLLAEQYVDFKFGTGVTNAVITALDIELG